MKKALLLTVLFASFTFLGFSQSDKFWSPNYESKSTIITHKAVARLSFPKEFKLYNLNTEAMKQQLFSITGRQARAHSTVITLPNADGELEKFEVFEASNFEPALQERFPEIRAFSGQGITDRYSTLKLSISPQGIQTMIFRTGKVNEFIEAYSNDNTTYAVFKSERKKGQLPWTCSTQDHEMFAGINRGGLPTVNNGTESSAGELKVMRLAQSCNGEYSNFFGAFNNTQVALVLAAFNATMTRCNGVYEKDLALHLNLIANTADVIYYDPATDPYTTLGAWNGQLQATLNTVIGAANYDIGHMFGASGGGGNAGCIGCVCNDSNKGSGITSPADGIPQGDNFDIDYVVHEVGHQLGGNHTFSQSSEGTGVNKEVGSGITIMGYAGITAHDVAPHSIDIFHEASIQQIQNNLANKTCPVTTNISATNATPVVAPVGNYTIPISTPFALTGSATDANAGDALTYCWEQNDDAAGQTGTNSRARENKPVGPNWLSFPPTASPTRTFPRLATILAGSYTTGPLPGGDAGVLIEALSNVGRTLNFRLTVRDNSPYSSTAPLKVGQTSYTDMVVTVSATSGPFTVTSPNTNVSWPASSTQTITWDVNNTTAAPVSCANVRILLSTDGGLTFPTVLVASTANDGSEPVTIPGPTTTTARVKVESIGNIFFDISNSNFTITVPASGFAFTAGATATASCPSPATVAASLATTATGGFSTPIVLTATAGVPAGTTVTFAPNPLTPGSSTFVTLNNANTLANGTYNVTVQGVAGAITQTTTVSFVISAGTAPTVTNPANVTVCAGATANFSVTASGPAVTGYQWQLNSGAGFANIPGATSASYTTSATTAAMNGYLYRVIATGQCGAATSASATLTVNSAPAITTQPTTQVVCAGNNATFSVVATGAGLTYQWQLNSGSGFANIAGATAASYTVNAVTLAQNGHLYQVVITGTCGSPLTSSTATLTVGNSAAITGQPASQTVCVGATPVNFTVTATGSSLTYQWQVNTGAGFTNIPGATAATYNAGPATAAMNGYQYRVNVFSCTPTPITSNAATLTVNLLTAVTTAPTNSTVCAGTTTTFSVVAAGTANAYQWQYSVSGCNGPWVNVTNTAPYSGATTATLTITAPPASLSGYGYRAVITGACNAVTSGCGILTVNTPIVVTTQPANASVCLPTTTTTLSVAVTGTAPTYQWQVSTDGGTTWTNIATATGATLTLNNLTVAMSGYQYRVVIAGTCTSSFNSAVATLAVNSPVAITDQPDDVSVCEGNNTSFTVAATGSTITYQWQVRRNGGPFINVVNGAPYAGATTPTLSITNATAGLSGNEYRVVVSGVPCGSVNSDTASLTVNALPGVVLVAAEYANLTPYTPSALYSTVSPAAGTYTYVWRRDGSVVAGATASSLPVNVDWFGEYDVTVTDLNGCSRTSNKVTVADSVDNLIFIYPNPSTGVFQVRYYSASTTEYSVSIYDSKGSRVWTKKYPVANRYEQMLVDLGRNAQGVYKVDVRDKNGKRLAAGNVLIKR